MYCEELTSRDFVNKLQCIRRMELPETVEGGMDDTYMLTCKDVLW